MTRNHTDTCPKCGLRKKYKRYSMCWQCCDERWRARKGLPAKDYKSLYRNLDLEKCEKIICRECKQEKPKLSSLRDICRGCRENKKRKLRGLPQFELDSSPEYGRIVRRERKRGARECTRCREIKEKPEFRIDGPLDELYSPWCWSCRKEVGFYKLVIKKSSLKAIKEYYGESCCSCGDKAERAHVDHCHRTGVIRGLLCHGCNVAAGMLKDSASKAYLLARYLNRNM